MNVRLAVKEDLRTLCACDRHIRPKEMALSIGLGRVYIIEVGGAFAGWLRYNLFWDNTPFMNMLYVLEPYRGQGAGRLLVRHWEDVMLAGGHDYVMTSTASDEYAQHFYHQLGYSTVGGFMPQDGPYEVILGKSIGRKGNA